MNQILCVNRVRTNLKYEQILSTHPEKGPSREAHFLLSLCTFILFDGEQKFGNFMYVGARQLYTGLLLHAGRATMTISHHVGTDHLLSVCPFVLMATFQVNLGQPVLSELRMMETVVTTGAEQSCNQIVTTNKPTPNFLQAGCPSCCPTNSVKALKGKFTFHGRVQPKLIWGLPTM